MLAELSANFTRSFFSANPSSWRWEGSALAAAATAATTSAVAAAARTHDRFLSVDDPAMALKVCGGLWSLAIVGQFFSVWTLATLAFAVFFTLPYAVHAHKAALLAVCEDAVAAAHARWAGLGLSRRQQAGGLLAAVVFIWLKSSWVNRCIGMFLGALAVRCSLKPAEVAALREHAAPLTMSVKKRAARLSLAATDFAHRTLGTAKAE